MKVKRILAGVIAAVMLLMTGSPVLAETAEAVETARTEYSVLETPHISDLVQVSVDNNKIIATKIYLNRVYETKITLTAGKHEYSVLINGEKYATRNVALSKEQIIYIRYLKSGEVIDSINNKESFHTATLVGNFSGIDGIGISTWDASDVNGELTYIGGGIFTRTFTFDETKENMQLADGGYKIALDNDLNHTIGIGNGSQSIPLTIPAGTTEITIFADEINGVVYDSIRSKPLDIYQNIESVTLPAFSATVSLIGTIRTDVGPTEQWNEKSENYDFYQLDETTYVYSDVYSIGDYEYKVVFNHSFWWESWGGANQMIHIAENRSNVVFVYDAKSDRIYDSINNPNTVSRILERTDLRNFMVDETGVLIHYVGDDVDVIIPDGGAYGVTSIGKGAFEDCSSLTSVTIPDSVTNIGSAAFSGCSSLTSITLPDSVTNIGSTAFSGCSSLTSITLPDSVTSIGYGTFLECSSLTSITIPNSVTSIGVCAFYGCISLTGIMIPDSVTSIGSQAFDGTAWYDNQPDGVVYAGKLAYAYKGDKTQVTTITLKDGTLGITEYAFEECSSLTSITISDSVTSIGHGAFLECSSLTSITIPDSVTSIGGYAFDGTAWYDNQPDGVVYAGKVAYAYKGDKTQVTKITLKDGTLGITDYAFSSCSSLTSITIPDSVMSIGYQAFYDCRSLTSITIPNSVTSIGTATFSRCSSLTSITIPNNVTSIGGSAFSDCSSLTSITIPDGVTWIGSSAFEWCSSLTSITIPNSVTWIGSDTFRDCRSLTSITIPDSVTWIGSSAFNGCYNLTIYGIAGSYAEVYAKANNIPFKVISSTKPFVPESQQIPRMYSIISGEDLSYTNGRYTQEETSVTVTVSNFSSSIYNYDQADMDKCAAHNVKVTVTASDNMTVNHSGKNTYQYHYDRLDLDDDLKINVPLSIVNTSLYKESYLVNVTVSADNHEERTSTYTIKVMKDRIELLADYPALTIGEGQTIRFQAVRYQGKEMADTQTGFSFVVSDNNIAQYKKIEDTADGPIISLKGIKSGTTMLTVTHKESGLVTYATVTVVPNVYTYREDCIPTQADGLNIYTNGLYVSDYERHRKDDNTDQWKMNIYNSMCSYGAVDVYDANGQWVKSVQIDKYNGGYATSIGETLWSGVGLVYDAIQGDLLTYRQQSFSQKTSVTVDVPKGGYIQITNDCTASTSALIYNIVDMLMFSASEVSGISKIGASSSEELNRKVTAEVFAQVMANDVITNGSNKFIKSLQSKISNKVTASTLKNVMSELMTDSENLLADLDIDLEKIILETSMDMAISLPEDAFTKLSGPIGATMSGLFTVSKYARFAAQLVHVCGTAGDGSAQIFTLGKNGECVSNGIQVQPEFGEFDGNYVLRTFEVREGSDYDKAASALGDCAFELYDIYMIKDDKETQLPGTVKVMIPIPSGFTGSKCQIYRIEEDGSKTNMKAVVDGNYLVFETNHFSLYAIAEMDFVKGDLTGDGKADISDLMMLAQAVNGRTALTAEQSTAADVTGDGKADIADLMKLAQFVNGKIDTLD